MNSSTFVNTCSKSPLFRRKPVPRFFITRSKSENSESNDKNETEGESVSTDWDRAWANFRKKAKKGLFSQFNMNKYVTWNPNKIDYPLSKETDPFRKAEKGVLGVWTSTKFTVVGLSIVVGLLIVFVAVFSTKGTKL